MQIKDYIQGDRHGKEANRLEREAMCDPFLQEALDGFDTVTGNHIPIIDQLERKFTQPAIVPHRTGRLFLYWSAAASVLLLIGLSAYFFLQRTEQTTTVIAMYQPVEKEDVSAMEKDFPAQQTMQMRESPQEMQAVAKAAEKMTLMPTNPSKAVAEEELSDIAVTNEIVDDAVVDDVIACDFVAVDTIFEEEADSGIIANVHPVVSSAKSLVVNNQALNEVVVTGYGTQRKSTVTGAVPAVSENNTTLHSFGEKEFQTWCRQKAVKNICNGQKTTVKLSFFVDENGKPTNIRYQNYTCEAAKEEMEHLLFSSPVWTKTNRKVCMTIKW